MSAKKATSGRRAAQAKTLDPGCAQSAAARRSAEAALSGLISQFAPAKLRLVAAMRRALQERLPTVHEVVYEYRNQGAVVISYSPNDHGYDGVLAIRADADGAKLYFTRGKELPDPEKLLQGSAQARWIEMESASTITRPAVVSLIEEAIARSPMPFAISGRGPLVIRSASSKQRRQKK